MTKTAQISESSTVRDLYQLLEQRCKELDAKYQELIGPEGLVYGNYDGGELSALLEEKRECHSMLVSIYGLLGR